MIHISLIRFIEDWDPVNTNWGTGPEAHFSWIIGKNNEIHFFNTCFESIEEIIKYFEVSFVIPRMLESLAV